MDLQEVFGRLPDWCQSLRCTGFAVVQDGSEARFRLPGCSTSATLVAEKDAVLVKAAAHVDIAKLAIADDGEEKYKHAVKTISTARSGTVVLDAKPSGDVDIMGRMYLDGASHQVFASMVTEMAKAAAALDLLATQALKIRTALDETQRAVDAAEAQANQALQFVQQEIAKAAPHAAGGPGTGAQPQLRLRLTSGRTLTLAPGTRLNVADLGTAGPGQAPTGSAAEVVRNPTNPDVLGLKNLSGTPWSAVMPGGSPQQIEGGRSLRLAVGTKINFGTVQGEVVG
jgi:hypothetical protein